VLEFEIRYLVTIYGPYKYQELNKNSFVFEEKKKLSRDLSLVGRVWPNKQFIMVEQ
jgi:hypothetical protein